MVGLIAHAMPAFECTHFIFYQTFKILHKYAGKSNFFGQNQSYPYYQDKKNSNNVNINFKTKKKVGNNEKNYSQYITSNNTYFPTI